MTAKGPSQATAPEYSAMVRRAKLRLLQMHYESGVGHIGGNLSAIDALLHLHHRVMGPNDRFVLSKGHAAGALYVTLWTTGELGEEQLETFHRDGTRLAGHPVPGWTPGIRVATGSLGHGVSFGAGMALARRLRGEPGQIYCLTSDGEWQEGSTWEALTFANHQRLHNLTIVVDVNGLQGFGTTSEVASLDDVAERVRAFGATVTEIDGHDPSALAAALPATAGGLNVVLLRTHKGNGVSFMQDRMEWHYLPLTDELYARAIEELGGA